jgi:DNA polymerase-3 subunit epsilon
MAIAIDDGDNYYPEEDAELSEEECQEIEEAIDLVFERDRRLAAEWARQLLDRQDFVILDTETTSLGPKAEIAQIAVINHLGQSLLNTLVKPIGIIEPGAARVHGITKERCQDAPSWPEVYEQLKTILAGTKRLIIYNADFDIRMIKQCCDRHGLSWAISSAVVECAMLMYSQYVGDWNNYRGNYRWQKLPSGNHSAVGDCRATLDVIRKMAKEVRA